MLAEKFANSISSLDTFLSPNVYSILSCSIKYDYAEDYPCLVDGFVIWDAIDKMLDVKGDEDYLSYNLQSLGCQPLFLSSEQFLKSIQSWDQFEAKYNRFFDWISHKKMVQTCFDLIQSHDGKFDMQALLILVSMLERGLGDVILTECDKCPNILRDLLLVPHLTVVLSPTVVKFLRLLIGPPVSLNLRNLAWHGFLGSNEIQSRYVCVLMCTIISIGDMLIQKKVLKKIQFRQFVVLPDVILFESQLTPLNEIKDSFSKFGKLLPTMEDMWHHSFHLFTLERYGECIVILLPLMEHMMRCVFALIHNNLERVITAESEVPFTTFDEIFKSSLHNGEKNKLPEYYGEPLMSILMDCLVYQAGPRIRDRISHGEIDVTTVNRNAAHSLMTICCLAQRRLLEDIKFKNLYSSKFHPISILFQKTMSLMMKLQNLKIHLLRRGLIIEKLQKKELCPRTNYENCCIGLTTLFNVDLKDCSCQLAPPHSTPYQSPGDSPQALCIITTLTLDTLYRYETATAKERKEREFISTFSKLVSQSHTNCDKLQDYINFLAEKQVSKQLRSRQRSTYENLLRITPTLISIIEVIIMLASNFLQNIQSTSYKPSPSQISSMQRSLKNLKKLSDNFENSFQKHRWQDLQEMATSFWRMYSSENTTYYY